MLYSALTIMKQKAKQESSYRKKESKRISSTICRLLAEIALEYMVLNYQSMLKNQGLAKNGGPRQVGGQITLTLSQLWNLI